MAKNSGDLDVLIIGGGPAGLSTALWCADLRLKAAVFEKGAEFGGQLLWTFGAIKNYLGIEAANGRELSARFLRHIENTDVMRFCNAQVVKADLQKKAIELADGVKYKGKSVVIATGVRRRTLNISGEQEFIGRGILESGAKSKSEVKGKTVVIIGGGDAALENALILSETAKKIFLVHRRCDFSARRDFVKQAGERANVEFLLDTSVSEIVGNAAVEGVRLSSGKPEVPVAITADHVLIRIGVVPNTELFHHQLNFDDSGFLSANNFCETDFEGVFAIGDVTNPSAPTICAAAGQSAAVAKKIFNILQA